MLAIRSGIFYFLLILIISNSSCQRKNEHLPSKDNFPDNMQLTDSFSDSLHVGKPGSNKVQLLKYLAPKADKSFVLIRLFEKSGNQWRLIYKDTIRSDGFTKLNAEIRDYNQDGFNDLKFSSRIGANMANSIYAVLLYSDTSKSFRKIGQGWNLMYSDKLKMFRGKYIASTVYADYYRIVKDSLVKAFEVNLSDLSESVEEYSDKGKIIKTTRTSLDTINYKLPKVDHWLREWTIKDKID